MACEPLKSVRQLCWPGPRGASTQGHPTPGTPPPSLDLLGDNRGCLVTAAAHEPPGLGNAPGSLRFTARQGPMRARGVRSCLAGTQGDPDAHLWSSFSLQGTPF